MPQAKKEEVPAEEEKSKVPQPDRTEYDAKAANGMLSKVYLVCIGIKSNLSRRLSAILVTAILVGFCTILYTNKTPHEGIH